MASRMKQGPARNDALTVMSNMFGKTPGWTDGVADAAMSAEIAEEVYALRERHNLTQLALAKLIGTSQSAIARLEDARYDGHSVAVLRRLAAAVGEQVSVKFIASTRDHPAPRRRSAVARVKQVGVQR